MKFGLMGGTFDPIHFGHLMMSEYIRTECGLDKIIFIPTGNPPHKSKQGLDARRRLALVETAVEDNPFFEVSDIEVNRGGFSYSVDTVLALKDEYPDDELFFLIGTDILRELKTWRRFDELAKNIEFILASRPGFDISREEMIWEIYTLSRDYEAKVTMVETPRYEISSTDLRKRLREKASVRYLIPDKVAEKIRKEGYYGAG